MLENDSLLERIWYRRRRFASSRERAFLRVWHGNRCEYCGKWLKSYDIEIDHIIPWSWGGYSILRNYALSCRTCNQEKGARTPIVWDRSRFANFRKGKGRKKKWVKRNDWQRRYRFRR